MKSLVDDFGHRIMVGDQKDIGEFNLNLLERIEEGLGESNYSNKDNEEEEGTENPLDALLDNTKKS